MARNKYPEVTVNRILDTSMQLFLEKGFEQTTIQDIVDALGDLSKGAIYHHFKSKEEILDAASDRLWTATYDHLSSLRKQDDLNGAEKLKALLHYSTTASSQTDLVSIIPDMMKNPRLLALELNSSMHDLAPNVIAPLIREGQQDGSIKTDYPDELAQVLSMLCNIWLNPVIFPCTEKELNRKLLFLQQMTEFWGFSLLDDQALQMIQDLRKLRSDMV